MPFVDYPRILGIDDSWNILVIEAELVKLITTLHDEGQRVELFCEETVGTMGALENFAGRLDVGKDRNVVEQGGDGGFPGVRLREILLHKLLWDGKKRLMFEV